MVEAVKLQPVWCVRWLQIGAAAAGIGIALVGLPGLAIAEEGASPPASQESETSPSPDREENSGMPAGADPATDDTSAPDAIESDVDDGIEIEDDVEIEDGIEIEDDVAGLDGHDEAEDDPAAAEAMPGDRRDRSDRLMRATAARTVSATPAEQDSRGPIADVDPSPVEVLQKQNVPDVAASIVTTTAQTTLATARVSCGCDKPRTIVGTIRVSVDRLLTDTANWLATRHQGPLTGLLEGALYLVRRTLFPASVGVITSPVKVPLYFTPTSSSSGKAKLGIWVAIGGSSTPQLFEFDTGSSGLYAAYSSAVPDDSPWWGANYKPTGATATVAFDSGLVYQGFTVGTSVSLFAGQDSCTALVSSEKLDVGQMNQIGTSGSPDAFWSPTGSTTGEPPIDGAFYGDFGMSLNYKPDGIMNVVTQLKYGWGVRPGFRVHVDETAGEAWVQIGLTRSDLRNSEAMYFPMIPDTTPPTAVERGRNKNLSFYELQLIDATINIVNEHGVQVVDDIGVPILPDTGASTTLHNTQQSSSAEKYLNDLVDWNDQPPTTGKLYAGYTFFLSGTTTAGTPVTFFEFETQNSVDDGRVGVQNASAAQADEFYYLNTGLSLFEAYDLVYSFGNGTLGLVPPPTPPTVRRRG